MLQRPTPFIGATVESLTARIHVRVQTAYDRMAPEYDHHFSTPVCEAENIAIARYLQRRGLLTGEVLDVGCGTGLLLTLAHLVSSPIQSSSYLGVDLSPGMLHQAVHKFPTHPFKLADQDELVGIPDRSFDSINSLFIPFSYSVEPRRAVHAFWRVLRPGGRVMVMVSGVPSLRRVGYFQAVNGDPHQGVTTYQAEELARLFKTHFHDVKVQGFSLWADKLAWLPRKLLNLYLRGETATFARLFPDRACFLIVTGRRL